MIAIIIAVFICVLIYHIVKPPTPKTCDSIKGINISSPRIKLRDGRYLAYKIRGCTIQDSKFKAIINHGFYNSKDIYIPVSDELLKELGVCMITFDRPGYAESDPNPNRSPKTDTFDIQELADRLELGSKFYVMGFSIGCYPVWGCLKYIPHRLAGAVIGVPMINYWWPSIPSHLRKRAFTNLPFLERCRLRIVHYFPALAWMLRRWIPCPTSQAVLKSNPKAFNKRDLEIFDAMALMPWVDKDVIAQQGEYECLYRDMSVTYSDWQFNPLVLRNPFPDNNNNNNNDKKLVHMWIGSEEGIAEIYLQRHIAERLPWIHCHEVPNSGHLIIHDPEVCEMMFKSIFLGEKPWFE